MFTEVAPLTAVNYCVSMQHFSRRLLVALCWLLPAAMHADCEDWCAESCEILNGNVEEECNDCSPEGYLCHPGARGYATWEERAREKHGELPDQMESVAVEPSGSTESPQAPASDEPVIEAEKVPCQILEAADVQGKSGEDLAALLNRPTIIRGLIDHWEAHGRFGSDATALESPGLDAFVAKFGNHTLLAKRANFAREKCNVRARHTATHGKHARTPSMDHTRIVARAPKSWHTCRCLKMVRFAAGAAASPVCLTLLRGCLTRLCMCVRVRACGGSVPMRTTGGLSSE